MQLDNGVEAWDFVSSQYVNSAVKNVHYYIRKHERWKLPDKAYNPLTTTYWHELCSTTDIQPTEASFYMSLIGILRWIFELG